MKKILKRLLTVTITLATLITALPAKQVQASSKSVVRLEKHPQYGYQFDSSYPAPFNYSSAYKDWWTFHMNVNGSGYEKIVYCMQYHIPCNTGDTYDHQTTHPDINPTQQKQLQRALIFGYNENTGNLYGGTWLDNAMATQAMVWVISGGQYGTSWESRIADNLLQDSPTARSIYNQIRANMESYDTIPSFTAPNAESATDYEMKYNMNSGKFVLTLEDSRNTLKYFDFSASGISMQRNGSKLLLSADTEMQFDTITIKANKNLPKDILLSLISATPEFWYNPTQQNFTSIDVGGSRETVTAFFKLHTEKIGHIKLKKASVDGGVKQPLQGIEFTLTLKSTSEVASTIVTDADGYAITPYLPYGTYHIEETKGADGYHKIEPFDVAINQNGKIYKYILENTVYETDVKIVKKDIETGKNIPLASTQFKIKDSAGNWVTQKYNYPTPTVIDTFETAQDGTLVLSEPLRYGNYELYEVKAPYGYTLSEEPAKFTVSSDNPSALLEVACSNKPVKGTVTIEKLGEHFTASDFRMTEYGKMFAPIYELLGLEGIRFKVTGKTTVGSFYEKIFKTNKDGKILIDNLPIGDYTVSEVVDDMTVGYITPDDQSITVKNGETTTVKVENKLIYGGFKLLKVNEDKQPLADVKFALYKADGTMLKEFETDKDGMYAMTDLLYGDYYLKELETVTGYSFDKEAVYAFSVSKDKKVIEITAINKKIPESPKTKTDRPKTGDTTNIVAMLALLGTSGVGLAGAYFFKKRKSKKS